MFCFKVVIFYTILYITITNCQTPPKIFPTDNSTFKILENNSSLLIKETTSIAPLIFPENNTNFKFVQNQTILEKLIDKENKINKDSSKESENTVPEYFPNNNGTKYKFINNSTLLEKLLAQNKLSIVTNKSHDKSKEIDDFNNNIKGDIYSPVIFSDKNEDDKINKNHITSKEDTSDENPKSEVELLQPNDDDNDVRINVTHEINLYSQNDHIHPHRGGIPFIKDQWPAVLAGVFTLIAVLCYVGLLWWRKFLEHRYGTRELLINEDDYSTQSMRNFEL